MFLSSKDMSFTSPSSLFSAYASLSASIMLFRSMANELIPSPVRNFLYSKLRLLFKPKTSTFTLIIEESDGFNGNTIYHAADRYLCTKIGSDTKCLRITKSFMDKNVKIHLEKGEVIADSYEGIDLKWSFKSTESQEKKSPHDLFPTKHESQHFELAFHKKDKDQVLGSYIPFILEYAKSMAEKERVLKMYTLNISSVPEFKWRSVNLEHPSTFDTLAMEPDHKRALMEDLDRFLKRKEFYKKVGRAWKRGYLLYGPPGTGKSSLVAAMANYLKFDVYDLQLANVMQDSDLRRLLLSTANKSILVIEDIDCSVDLPDRHPASVPVKKGKKQPDGQRRQPEVKLTLSGLLNFIDGLWSSCGDERIIIFTTNHREKLDPALLRPGRMDMHVHMSYCSFHGFKLLASTYLGISNHPYLFGEVESLIDNTNVTPAEVAEEFMKNEDANIALEGLVKLLKRKKMEGDQETETQSSREIKYPQLKRVKADKKPRKSPRVVTGSKKETRGKNSK